MYRRAFGGLLVGGLSHLAVGGPLGCSPARPPRPTGLNARAFYTTMSFEEARATIAELRAKHDSPKPPAPGPVTTIEEVVRVLERDELHRFRSARDVADGLVGVDGLVLRAALELVWAGTLATAHRIVEELLDRAQSEAEAITMRRPSNASDPQLLAEVREHERDYDRLRDALAALAIPHREVGTALAAEALRAYPNEERAYVVTAMAHRQHDAWTLWDAAMQEIDDRGLRTPVVAYLRAMEKLERYADPAGCRAALEAIAKQSELVRVRASLILVQPNIDARMSALATLEEVAPHHVVVRIAGDVIREAYATSKQVQARGG